MQRNGVWIRVFLEDPESRGGCFENNKYGKNNYRLVIEKNKA